MEDGQNNLESCGGEEAKKPSSDMGHVTPSLHSKLVDLVRNESDIDFVKKQIFEITGKQATREDILLLKAEIAREDAEMTLASYHGTMEDRLKMHIVDLTEVCHHLKKRVLDDDPEALKHFDKSASILERMVNKRSEAQNNIQINFNAQDKKDIMEVVYASQ